MVQYKLVKQLFQETIFNYNNGNLEVDGPICFYRPIDAREFSNQHIEQAISVFFGKNVMQKHGSYVLNKLTQRFDVHIVFLKRCR